MLIMIAVCKLNNRIGTMKVNAKMNLERKVEIVDSHISFVECLFVDSSEMWIPNASDMASAIAIMSIPPMITRLEWVLECNPIIRPSVVITPDVKPKLKPLFIEYFIV